MTFYGIDSLGNDFDFIIHSFDKVLDTVIGYNKDFLLVLEFLVHPIKTLRILESF